MGTPKNRIALNGKIYDVTTGSLMSKLPSFTKATKRRGTPPKTITKNKTIDGFVHAPIFKTINQIVENYFTQDEFPSPKRKKSC